MEQVRETLAFSAWSRPSSLALRLDVPRPAKGGKARFCILYLHGFGSAQSSIDNERADMITFLLWQFGVPGYAPTAGTSSARAGH